MTAILPSPRPAGAATANVRSRIVSLLFLPWTINCVDRFGARAACARS